MSSLQSQHSDEYNLNIVRPIENNEDEDDEPIAASDQRQPLLTAMAEAKDLNDRNSGAVAFVDHAEAVWKDDGRDIGGTYVPRGLCNPVSIWKTGKTSMEVGQRTYSPIGGIGFRL